MAATRRTGEEQKQPPDVGYTRDEGVAESPEDCVYAGDRRCAKSSGHDLMR
jgi:hypothetical protein